MEFAAQTCLKPWAVHPLRGSRGETGSAPNQLHLTDHQSPLKSLMELLATYRQEYVVGIPALEA